MSSILFLILSATAPADRPIARTWQDALELPISPGSVALLVGHVEDERVRARWREALSDPEPNVRAAAARVLAVSGVVGLREQLLTALAEERDETVAAEMVRAAVVLRSPRDHPILQGVVARRGAAADAYLIALAWTLGAELFADAALVSRIEAGESRVRLMTIAARGEVAGFTRLGIFAIRSGDPALWDDLLVTARVVGRSPDDGLLSVAAASPSEDIRILTYFHFAALGRAPAQVPTMSLAAASAAGTSASADLEFAFALLERSQGRQTSTDVVWVARARSTEGIRVPSDLTREPRLLRLLTDDERAALAARFASQLRGTKDGREITPLQVLQDRMRGRERQGDVSAPLTIPRVRMASGLPLGLVGDLIRLTGCRTSDYALGLAQLSYRHDGTPSQVGMVDSRLTPQCEAVSRAVLPLVWASDQTASEPKRVDLIVLPLDSNPAACEVPASNRSAALNWKGEHLVEPKKTRNVTPFYPDYAKRNRLEGVVILEAVVNEVGCVRELTVLRGIHPALDGAAVRAVSGWRYTPTLLEGNPVPVVMTVTVNFKLR